MPSLSLSVASLLTLIISSRLSVATIDCNHAKLEGGEGVLIAGVCMTEGPDSHMMECRDGEGFLKTYPSNQYCGYDFSLVLDHHQDLMAKFTPTPADSLIAFDSALSDYGYSVVCNAEPCDYVKFNVYDRITDYDYVKCNTYPPGYNYLYDHNETHPMFVGAEDNGDWINPYAQIAFIVDACQPISESKSIVVTCVGDAACDGVGGSCPMIRYYANGECMGTGLLHPEDDTNGIQFIGGVFGDHCGAMAQEINASLLLDYTCGRVASASFTVDFIAPLLITFMGIMALLNA